MLKIVIYGCIDLIAEYFSNITLSFDIIIIIAVT